MGHYILQHEFILHNPPPQLSCGTSFTQMADPKKKKKKRAMVENTYQDIRMTWLCSEVEYIQAKL